MRPGRQPSGLCTVCVRQRMCAGCVESARRVCERISAPADSAMSEPAQPMTPENSLQVQLAGRHLVVRHHDPGAGARACAVRAISADEGAADDHPEPAAHTGLGVRLVQEAFLKGGAACAGWLACSPPQQGSVAPLLLFKVP